MEKRFIGLILSCQVCLGSVSKDFTNNDSFEISLDGTLYDFLVDYGSTGDGNILKIFANI